MQANKGISKFVCQMNAHQTVSTRPVPVHSGCVSSSGRQLSGAQQSLAEVSRVKFAFPLHQNTRGLISSQPDLQPD